MKSVLSSDEQRFLDKKYGTIAGVALEINDCDNTVFTDFFEANYLGLINYAKTMNIDVSKASDLIHDTWASYRINENNGKGYDMTAGHGLVITIEEAVKARIKNMSRNTKYHRATDGGNEVLAHFTEDNKDDSVQNAYTQMASVEDVNTAIIEEAIDLAENMQYFISCTKNCRVSGLDVLDKLDLIIKSVEADIFNAEFIGDLWSCGDGIKDCFRTIFNTYSLNKNTYMTTLASVREEFMSCRIMA